MNVDKNPAYRAAVEALKADGTIPRRVALRQCQYLNNVIEHDPEGPSEMAGKRGCGRQELQPSFDGARTRDLRRDRKRA
jgi:hypothetical protein